MKNKGTFATVFSFAERCRGKMILSVTFAVLSVTGGLLPYLGIYKIILFFFEGTPSIENIIPWILLCVAGYAAKLLFHGISTSLSHISAYRILENIRMALSEKLMKISLGKAVSQTA